LPECPAAAPGNNTAAISRIHKRLAGLPRIDWAPVDIGRPSGALHTVVALQCLPQEDATVSRTYVGDVTEIVDDGWYTNPHRASASHVAGLAATGIAEIVDRVSMILEVRDR
jgi:hypothetical protein